MSQGTKIEWAEDTWNIVVGCSKVSEGCKNCYAIPHAYRLMHNPNKKVSEAYAGTAKTTGDGLNWTGKVNLRKDLLKVPFNKKKPTRYFVNSMSDLFHPEVPHYFIEDVFLEIAKAHWHTFMILTKRPENLYKWADNTNNYLHLLQSLKNCWIGVSTENQEVANKRILTLLSLKDQIPNLIYFISAEPLLGQLNLAALPISGHTTLNCLSGVATDNLRQSSHDTVMKLDWVITGAESGHGARPMNEDWVKSLQQQCAQAGVSFFYKQRLDEKGKKVSLPELDGRQWAQFPKPMLVGMEG